MIPTHKKLFEQDPDLKNVKFYIDPDLGTGALFNPFVGQLDPNPGKKRSNCIRFKVYWN